MIRVLVVDDSAFMRRLLVKLLEPHEDIEVVATAIDGVFALDNIQKIESSKPDVVTLDLEMPRLDGMSTLRRIVDDFQLPVILVSAHTSEGATVTFEGLAAGAVDFVTKPDRIHSSPMGALGADLVAKIRVAAKAKVRRSLAMKTAEPTREPRRAPLSARVAPERDVVGIAISSREIRCARVTPGTSSRTR
jgi:two-component system chemotaxis response regulator CheB